MPSDSRRPERVAEAIREIIASALTDETRDPRFAGLVTVTGVDVTRDLRHARVFVSVMGTDEERGKSFEALGESTGYFRTRVGKALRLRVAPEIAFKLDETIARAARIDALLESIREPTPPPTGNTDPRE
jgi:ribosome-binding factor A